MFLTLDNFNEEPSAIVQVDASTIDVSDFQDEEDQSFLITHGYELRIDARLSRLGKICRQSMPKLMMQKAAIYESRSDSSNQAQKWTTPIFHSGHWHPTMQKMG